MMPRPQSKLGVLEDAATSEVTHGWWHNTLLRHSVMPEPVSSSETKTLLTFAAST